MIYNMYVFDKLGNVLYYGEWTRYKQSGISFDEEAKLMYGMLFSMTSFATKISPTGRRDQYLVYKTNKYAMHMFETLSGLKFVLNTSPSSIGVRDFLQQYYLRVWVQYATNNFLWKGDSPIQSDLFKSKSTEFVKNSNLDVIKTV